MSKIQNCRSSVNTKYFAGHSHWLFNCLWLPITRVFELKLLELESELGLSVASIYSYKSTVRKSGVVQCSTHSNVPLETIRILFLTF